MTSELKSNFLTFKIRFNEVDPLGIVWHGHYIRFFEDGREAFGAEHGLSYMDIYRHGYFAPVVKLNCDYKKSLEYGDVAVIETSFINHSAAKLVFKYRITLEKTSEIIAEGESTQVFVGVNDKSLQLTAPQFFSEWKKSNNLVL
jgi:acyl-CoA thioester hydrolase